MAAIAILPIGWLFEDARRQGDDLILRATGAEGAEIEASGRDDRGSLAGDAGVARGTGRWTADSVGCADSQSDTTLGAIGVVSSVWVIRGPSQHGNSRSTVDPRATVAKDRWDGHSQAPMPHRD
jgi:ribosomal protein S3